jgi:RNA polymerase sigma factor (TIGR02999 family)
MGCPPSRIDTLGVEVRRRVQVRLLARMAKSGETAEGALPPPARRVDAVELDGLTQATCAVDGSRGIRYSAFMPDSSAERRSDVTDLLRRWREGDRDALERLMPLVYEELHRIASRYLAHERSDHTLQSTALVHEAFVRLVDQRRVGWENRAQFFGLAAQAMRRILVDHARARNRQKRGASANRIALESIAPPAAFDPVDPADAIALDSALQKLDGIDSVQARIVELRFFGGLTVDETADVLDTSPSTVKREWTLAKAWLYRELAGMPPDKIIAPDA